MLDDQNAAIAELDIDMKKLGKKLYILSLNGTRKTIRITEHIISIATCLRFKIKVENERNWFYLKKSL